MNAVLRFFAACFVTFVALALFQAVFSLNADIAGVIGGALGIWYFEFFGDSR